MVLKWARCHFATSCSLADAVILNSVIGTVFTDRSYEDIFPSPSHKRPPRRNSAVVEAPAAPTSTPHWHGRWDDAPLCSLRQADSSCVSSRIRARIPVMFSWTPSG